MKPKKLLITLLTTLMIVTCGTVNVFAKSKFTITKDPNGGEFAKKQDASVSTSNDDNKTKYVSSFGAEPKLEGYKFEGYTITKDEKPIIDTSYGFTADTTIYAYWTKLSHTHGSWTYKANNATLTATCGAAGCDAPAYSVSLTLIAPESSEYTGSKLEATLSGSSDWTKAGLEVPTIVYNTEPINAGKHKASITVNGETAVLEYEIGKAQLTVTPENKSVIFGDGIPNYTSVITGFKGSDTNDNVTITGSPAYTCAYTKDSLPNSYTISVNVSGLSADNYTFIAGSDATLIVNNKKITAPTANNSTFTYNGTEQTYTPNGFDKTTMDIDGNEQTDANTTGYIVSVTPKEGYEWTTGGTDAVKFTWIIGKADPSYTTEPQANIKGVDFEGNVFLLCYNRKAQTLVTPGETEDGVIMYALGVGEDGSNEPELNKYKDNLDDIFGIEAGDYYVFYYIKGDDNHNDSSPAYIKVTITKKTFVKNPFRVVGTYTYDGTDQTPKLEAAMGSLITDADYEVEPDEKVDYNNTGIDIPFRVILKGNFEGEYDMTFSIDQKVLKAEWPTDVDCVYNGLAYAPEATVATGVDDEEVILVYSYLMDGKKLDAKPVNAGEYTAEVNLDSNEDINKNYIIDSTTSRKDYKITEKELKVTWDYTTPYIYDGQDHKPIPSVDSSTLPAGDDEVKFDVEIENTAKVDEAINVDDYTATASLEDNAINKNYKLDNSTTTKEFKIVPRALEGHWDYLSFEEDGEAHNPNYVFDNVVSGDTVNATLTGDKDKTDVGVYFISASLANTYKNYSFTSVDTVYYILDDVNGKIASGVFEENSKDIEDASMTEITASDVSKFNNEELSMALTKKANIRIYTIIDNISDNKVFEDKKLNEDNSILFDVTLYSQIENSIPVKLHNTNDYKVSITIKVSEEELTKRGIIGSNKEYFVYAAHEDGEITTYEKLPVYKVTKNEDGTYSFTFSTNKFSSFSLYSTEKDTPKPHKHSSKKTYVSPKTSVN